MRIVIGLCFVIALLQPNYWMKFGLFLMTTGGLLNLLAVEANDGKMPVFENREIGGELIWESKQDKDTHLKVDINTKMVNKIKFPCLCDGIQITMPFPGKSIGMILTISIGDMVIIIGVLITILTILITD